MKDIAKPIPDVNGADSTVSAGHKAAFEAHEAGLCVVPPAEDGTKRPKPNKRGNWKSYQTRRSSREELDRWYGPPNGCTGLGVITGLVSDRRETWDFDDRDTYEAFVEDARRTGLGNVVERIVSVVKVIRTVEIVN